MTLAGAAGTAFSAFFAAFALDLAEAPVGVAADEEAEADVALAGAAGASTCENLHLSP